jgi:hypothetical protein
MTIQKTRQKTRQKIITRQRQDRTTSKGDKGTIDCAPGGSQKVWLDALWAKTEIKKEQE